MPKIITYDFIKSAFDEEGYKLLNTDYISAHKQLNYLCPIGHKHKITWNNWKHGHRCPHCAPDAKLTIDFIKHSFENNGYSLLTSEYKNNKQKLDYICPNGHRHSISWKNWKTGSRCVFCDQRKTDYNFIKQSFDLENYTLKDTTYINCKHKLAYICPNGHMHSVRWDDWSNGGTRCLTCNYIKRSGSGHPNWLGGISFEPYAFIFGSKEFKESIKFRDNYKCQNPYCWKKDGKAGRLTIHHIDYDKKNCDKSNLITLCNSCNSRANKFREWHQNYYAGIIKNNKEVVHYEIG